MATVVYKNAVVLVDGAAIRASLNELGIEFSAEMLDGTTFGSDTRVHKGGLLVASVAGAGFAESGDGAIETVVFGDVGTDDVIVAVFPDGIIEGSVVDGRGYALKAVGSEMSLGGAVGALLPMRFTFEGRGVEA